MVQGVRFASPADGSHPLAELPAPVGIAALPVETEAEADFWVLSIPAEATDPLDPAERVRRWLSPDRIDPPGYQLVAMHGAQVHWCPPRLAVVAPPEQVDPVRRALLEVAYLEAELRAVETGLAELWPRLEADASRAFEFRERDLGQRQQLAGQFQKVLLLRSRLAKITPRLLIPQAYPPTLPGQVHERLRERLGMSYRLESLETQLELFEQVYDGCGQRASEFVLARKGLTLEWVIIILLAIQIVLSLFDLLTAATTTS